MAKGFGGGSNIHGHCPSQNRHNDRRRCSAPLRGRKSPLLIVLFSPRPLCPNDLQRRSCSCCQPASRPAHPADRRALPRGTPISWRGCVIQREACRNLEAEDRAPPSPTMGLFYISLFLLVRSVYFHNGSSARKSAKFPSRRRSLWRRRNGVHKKGHFSGGETPV